MTLFSELVDVVGLESALFLTLLRALYRRFLPFFITTVYIASPQRHKGFVEDRRSETIAVYFSVLQFYPDA